MSYKSKPNSYYHEVLHYQQRWHWDCGVACVMMLLSPEQRDYFQRHFRQVCSEEGMTETTWTIDLCYLLKQFKIKHKMYITKAGINEQHRRHSYYRNIIDTDRARVESRFQLAAASGIEVLERTLTTAELVSHLAHGPAILLVDARLLACDLCKHNKMRAELSSWFGASYCGHYILVVGARRGRLLYRDPALRPRICGATTAHMRRAAGAAGTDGDCVRVYL